MLHCMRGKPNDGLSLKIPSHRSTPYLDPDSAAALLQDQGYTFGQTIGKGSYCKVKIVYRLTKGSQIRKIACKIIDKYKASSDFVTKFLPRELFLVRGLRHPNIVTVLDVLNTSQHVYLFMDLCEKGDLLEHIRAKGALAEYRSRHFFRQIVSAVHHLHSLDIAHRDLKCENILLATEDQVKIADFGFARWCHNDKGHRILSETFCGSAAYAAPEILQGTMYNPKMYDSWSLGCILFIMLTASMPFDDASIPKMIKAQTNRQVNFPDKIDIGSAVCQLILHLLEPDVTRRATVRQIRRSHWLRHPPNKVLCDSLDKAIDSLTK